MNLGGANVNRLIRSRLLHGHFQKVVPRDWKSAAI